MENNYITQTELWKYMSKINDVKTSKKVELWMNSNGSDNILPTEIIDFLWKVII